MNAPALQEIGEARSSLLEGTLSTFRDPAGSLRLEPGRAIRTIDPEAREWVLEFLNSDFCRNAQARGEMIGAEIEESPDTGLRLIHPRIEVVTYPWEWTPAQWLAAAELTLRLGREAVAKGWILKDATPLNVLFVGTRPIFVDILSFERRDPGNPIWLAYAQYIRTFLLPLLAHRMLKWPLALTLLRRDGYEPGEIYAALGALERLSPAVLGPVSLPVWLESRAGSSGSRPQPARKVAPEVATAVLTRTLAELDRKTRRAAGVTSASQWSQYPATLTHYTAEQSADKAAWVRGSLERIRPGRVLDIGANTGEFSAMAATAGAQVVALERDLAAADRIFGMARDRGLAVLPVHADLSRPTPGAGWENRECAPLLPRLEGQFDLVMMLAVIHHLILMEQIPIPAILSLVYRLTRRYLILEWVPVDDPMYQSLMRGRDALYGSLSEDDLLAACEGRFRAVERHPLGNGRVLFLFEKTL